jgi:hypothetical protein
VGGAAQCRAVGGLRTASCPGTHSKKDTVYFDFQPVGTGLHKLFHALVEVLLAWPPKSYTMLLQCQKCEPFIIYLCLWPSTTSPFHSSTIDDWMKKDKAKRRVLFSKMFRKPPTSSSAATQLWVILRFYTKWWIIKTE